jgi:cyanophycin synthetase
VDTTNSAHWEAGQRLLMNRNVQAAVFENGAESICAQVWPADRCQIGVVTDMSGRGAGNFDVTDDAQMYKVSLKMRAAAAQRCSMPTSPHR